MNKLIIAAASLALVFPVVGCSQSASTGAGIGAASGAVIGGLATGSWEGAAIGAAAGGATGAIVGKASEPNKCVFRDPYGRQYTAAC